MSDKLIEAFLQMHDKKQIDERLVSDQQRKSKLAPMHTQGAKQTSAITAREPAEPPKTFGQKAAEIGRGIEAGLRGAAAGATDLGQTSFGYKPLSQYVTDYVTPGREQKLSQEFPRITSASKDAGSVGSMVAGVPGLVKGATKFGVKTAVKNSDDILGAAKSLDGEITTAMPKSGYKDITPSASTAVARTSNDLKTAPSSGSSTALSRPNSSSVGPAMKTIDNVARALPSASDASKALGGFGKVPMGKVAAAGAGVAAGTAAATLGSKPAGETKAATPEPDRAKIGKAMAVAGVERQNPISTPGTKTSNLKLGSKGDDVKALQRQLGVAADGVFGPQTAAALKAYQQKNKLKVDAIAGDQTMSSLRRTQAMSSLNKESTEMNNKLIEAFMQLHSTNSSNLFAEAKKAKKLDPVGKEDEDIDNDGDKDKSDSYLHNRRKAIKAAMKEAKDPHAELDAPSSGGKAPEMTTNPDYIKKKPAGGNSKVIQTGPNSSTVTKSTNEEVEQIDESLSSAHKEAIAKHIGKMWGKKGNISFSKEGGKHFVSHSDGIETHVHSIDMKKGVPHVTHFMTMQEEVEFSEAELNHIASILEANPVAPVPDDYSGASNGVSKRDLSDETVAEEEMKRGRGRPKGSKSGARTKSGGSVTGESETKNLAAQIRFASSSGASDGKGNMMLKHPTTGASKAVPAKAATEFYKKYTAAEKPAQKQAHHDEFLAKHFGGGEKPKTSGISLPKMPAPKS